MYTSMCSCRLYIYGTHTNLLREQAIFSFAVQVLRPVPLNQVTGPPPYTSTPLTFSNVVILHPPELSLQNFFVPLHLHLHHILFLILSSKKTVFDFSMEFNF